MGQPGGRYLLGKTMRRVVMLNGKPGTLASIGQADGPGVKGMRVKVRHPRSRAPGGVDHPQDCALSEGDRVQCWGTEI